MNWEEQIKKISEDHIENVSDEQLDEIVKTFAKFVSKHQKELMDEGFSKERAIKFTILHWQVYLLIYSNEGKFPHDVL